MADAPIRAGRVCALILAGGRSSRMGRDKALLSLNGHGLLERAVDFWRGAAGVESVILSVGQAEHFSAVPGGVIPVADIYPGQGPMAGLHAAFAQTDAEVLYVSAVDMPFLRQEALLPPPKGDAAVYTNGGRPEPLFGVYRRSILPALEAALAAGQRKMTALLAAADTEYVPLPEALAPALANLNTLPDFWRAAAGTPPMLAVTGWSGSGKTTFLEKLLPALSRLGVRAAVIKHDAHGFGIDDPQKDTGRLARAGAVCTAIAGPNGWAVMGREEISPEAFRPKLPEVDIIILEGYKHAPLPKIEVHRRATGKPFITHDATLVAAVTDEPLNVSVPQFGLEDADGCAALIREIFLEES